MTTIDSARDMNASASRSARGRSATTGSPTAPTSARCTRRCSRTTCAASCSTATSIHARSGTARTWPRTRAFQRNTKIWFGWLAKYDSVYHLGTTEQAVEQPLVPDPAPARQAPITASGRTSGPTSSSTPRTTSRPGPTGRGCSPTTSTITTTPPCSAPTTSAERRQRVRRLQRGAVHGCRVAEVVGEVGARQQAGEQEGPVRDLGQRLVQRAVPVLAGRRAQADQGRRPQGRQRVLLIDETATRRRRTGQPRGAQALPEVAADRSAGRHLARQLAQR